MACQTLLEQCGCDEGQGFGISRPLPVPDLEDWLGTVDRRKAP